MVKAKLSITLEKEIKVAKCGTQKKKFKINFQPDFLFNKV
jgi:hypothetical protein